VGIDDELRRRHQDGVAIMCRAGDSLGPDGVARARPVLYHDGLALLPADLIAEQPRQSIGTAARRGRNDDLDCRRCLRQCRRRHERPRQQHQERAHQSPHGSVPVPDSGKLNVTTQSGFLLHRSRRLARRTR
jgi:hypothetical protein